MRMNYGTVGEIVLILTEVKKLLVIQCIHGAAKNHEFDVIIEKAKVDRSEALSWDIFDQDQTQLWQKHKDTVKAIIIGGSPYSVYEEHLVKELELLKKVLCNAMEREIPILGICFGHQVLSYLLGGEVRRDMDRREKGFAEIHRHEEGNDDPLFSKLPTTFVSRVNHSDHVMSLPENTIHICYNDTSFIQAFRHTEKPVWGVQFHPEMSEEDVLYRYTHFADTYFISDQEREVACEELVETSPEVHRLLEYFWEYAEGK